MNEAVTTLGTNGENNEILADEIPVLLLNDARCLRNLMKPLLNVKMRNNFIFPKYYNQEFYNFS